MNTTAEITETEPRILRDYKRDRKSVVTRNKRGSSQQTLAMREKLDAEVRRAFASSGLPSGLQNGFETAYKSTLLGCACAIKRRKLEHLEEWPEMVGVSCHSMLLYIMAEQLGCMYNRYIEELFTEILRPHSTVKTDELMENHRVQDVDGEVWEGEFELISTGVKNLKAWAHLYAFALDENDTCHLIDCVKTDYGLARLSREGYKYIYRRLHDIIVRDIETRIGHAVNLVLPKRKTLPPPLVARAPDKTELKMNAFMTIDLQK